MPGQTDPADRAMDAALKQLLRRTEAGPGEQPSVASGAPCDAEMAAAYVEGRLERNERQSFEGHIAACGACRALTVALAREAMPDGVEAPAPRAAPEGRAAKWWDWRWAVPALAAIAIVTSAVYYQREQVLRQAGVTAVSDKVEESASHAAPAPAAPTPLVAEPVGERPPAAATNARRPTQPLSSNANARSDGVRASAARDSKEAPPDALKQLQPAAKARPQVGVVPGTAGTSAALPPAAPSSPADRESVPASRAIQLQESEAAQKAKESIPAAPPAPPTLGAQTIRGAAQGLESATLDKDASQSGITRQTARQDEERKKAIDQTAAASNLMKARRAGPPERSAANAPSNVRAEAPISGTASAGGYAIASKTAKIVLGADALPGQAPLRAYTEHRGRLWAVSDGGMIYRSVDAGRTWERLPSPTTADLVKVQWESEEVLTVEDAQGNRYSIKP